MKLYSLLFFIFASLNVTGQKKQAKKYSSKKDVYACVRQPELSPQERLENYPFYKAKKIELVSFSKNIFDKEINDSTELLSIPKINGYPDLSIIKQKITLSNKRITKLTDLIYNIGIKGNVYTTSISTAVGLDAAILFRDGKGHVFEYIEICFDCMDYSLRLVKVGATIGRPCTQKMEMLKSFFVTSGMNF